jgi:glycosyltransferase involved in cell wall biosynthesis
MTAPRVSIVLPTHNGERFLAQSIESCLSQPFRDIELIVVDDCSTDSTPRIARRYAHADPRVRVLRNDPNRKLPASLNRGFSEARGAYLTWTSDDNWYRPDAIGSMAEFLDAHADVGLVYAGMTDVDDAGAELKRRAALPPECLVEWSCVGACFLYRREVRDRLGAVPGGAGPR